MVAPRVRIRVASALRSPHSIWQPKLHKCFYITNKTGILHTFLHKCFNITSEKNNCTTYYTNATELPHKYFNITRKTKLLHTLLRIYYTNASILLGGIEGAEQRRQRPPCLFLPPPRLLPLSSCILVAGVGVLGFRVRG